MFANAHHITSPSAQHARFRPAAAAAELLFGKLAVVARASDADGLSRLQTNASASSSFPPSSAALLRLIRESPAANKSHNVAHIDDDDDDTLDETLLHLPRRGTIGESLY